MAWVEGIIRTALIWIVGTTLARGILQFINSRGYYPDQWISAMINKIALVQLPGVNWILAGLFGFCCLAAWETFHVDEWLSERLTPSPIFSAEVRSAIIDLSPSPLTMFLYVHPSATGLVASPIRLLAYLQITNRQDVPSKINSYSIMYSDREDDRGPWKPVKNLDLFGAAVYTPHTGAAPPKSMLFPKGLYLLATPKTPDDLKSAVQVIPQPLFDNELQKQMNPHGSTEGWIALEIPNHVAPAILYKMTVKDSAGATESILFRLPKKDEEGTTDTGRATMLVTPIRTDLSAATITPFSEP